VALLTDKMLFLHLPKTGGTYARAVIDSLAQDSAEIDSFHCRFDSIPKNISDDTQDGLLVWGLTRHPITWYQSRWAHRCVNGWRPDNSFDFNCISNDFNIFVNNCLDSYPDGWLTQDYANFFSGIPHRFKLYVGRYEDLDNSIRHALIESETLYCESEYPEIDPVNVSLSDGLSSSKLAVYDKHTFERVLDVERQVIDRYYGGISPKFEVFSDIT